MKTSEILKPEQRRTSKAYLANELRKAVFTWREHGYPHTTDTTLRLLQFWFEEEIFKDTDNSIERKTKAFRISHPISAMFFLNLIHQS